MSNSISFWLFYATLMAIVTILGCYIFNFWYNVNNICMELRRHFTTQERAPVETTAQIIYPILVSVKIMPIDDVYRNV
jgi:hypothetical protein